MGSFFCLLLLGVCVFFWVGKNSVFVAAQSTQGTIFINGTASIAATDHDFICATLDWWPPDKCDYGTCSWGRASLLYLDLTNPILLNAIKAFSPLKIRMGGTLKDKVIYETPGKPCTPFSKNSLEMFGFSQGCLPMSRWDELNTSSNKLDEKQKQAKEMPCCLLLWHRLMGRNALSTTFSGTKKIRAYARCSKATQGITLRLINLDGKTTVQVGVSTENIGKIEAWTMPEYQNRRAKFAGMSRSSLDENTKEEYHLTAKDVTYTAKLIF